MKISGTSVLHAAPAQVWDAITDPGVLTSVIPGCQALNPLGDNHFGLTVAMGVAAIKGTYAGEVKLYDLAQPTSLTMRAAGAGAPGTIDTTVAVRLTDVGDGTTRLDYDADAAVGGMVGGVGQRVLTSVAKKTAAQFFSAIDDVLTGRRPAGAAVAGVGTGAAVPVPGAAVPAAGAAVPAAGAAVPATDTGSAPTGLPAGPGAGPAAPAAGGGQAGSAGGAALSGPGVGAAPSPQPFGATLTGVQHSMPGAGTNPLVFFALGAAAVAIGVLLGGRIARRAA